MAATYTDHEVDRPRSLDDDEKLEAIRLETVGQTVDPGPILDAGQTKRLLRKVDWHLIPFLSLLYLLSFLDRTNIGNAKLFGLEKDLGLLESPPQYNIALSVFFITYVLFEVPSNMVLKRWRASMWFPIIMLGWGIVMTLTGLVKDFNGLVIARVFLGITEAGLFPGVNYYITLWYVRKECALRAAIFFSAATVAGAFGGLLARGINEMAGVGGRPGWAWIFILEGLLTVVVAVIAFWALADSPKTAKFLTEEEATQLQARLSYDNDGLASHYDIKFMYAAFKDWKIWIQSLSYLGVLTPLYSFSLFLPSILTTMGYTAATAQLLTVPVYVAGCICTVIAGWYSDYAGKRGIVLFVCALTALAGYILLISSSISGLQYAGTFLAACGVYPMIPVSVMWNGNNIGGSTKRGVGIAMQIGFGNCGGVIASFIYRNVDRPRYFLGHGACIGFISLTLTCTIVQMFVLSRINKQRDADNPPPATYTVAQKEAEADLGDKASFFRYAI